MFGDDLAAEIAEVGGEGVRQGLRASGDDGPARGVGGGGEDQAGGGRGDAGERQDGVCGAAGEEGARGVVAEDGFGEEFGRPDGGGAEGGHGDGVGGDAEERLGEVVDEGGPVADGGREEVLPGAEVVGVAGAEELGGGGAEIVVEQNGGAVRQWMGERDVGLDPAKAVVIERQGLEERRGDAEGVAG